MNPIASSPVAGFTWARFSILALLILGIVNGPGFLAPDIPVSVRLAALFMSLSVLLFFTIRFRSIRKDLTLGHVTKSQILADLESYLLGPTRFRWVWIGVTVALAIALEFFAERAIAQWAPN
jgi:hypothetical protein